MKMKLSKKKIVRLCEFDWNFCDMKNELIFARK